MSANGSNIPSPSRLSASGGHGTGFGSPLASTSRQTPSISTIKGLEADAELAPRPSATSPATAIAVTIRIFFITILLHQGEALVPHGCPEDWKELISHFSVKVLKLL